MPNEHCTSAGNSLSPMGGVGLGAGAACEVEERIVTFDAFPLTPALSPDGGEGERRGSLPRQLGNLTRRKRAVEDGDFVESAFPVRVVVAPAAEEALAEAS